MRPGIYPTFGIEAYHRPPGISKTGLVLLDEAPSVYRYALDNRDDASESKALRIGKGLHCAMEGKFEVLYCEGPDVARNAKSWRDFENQHPDKVCLQPSEALGIRKMKAAVDAYRPAQEILSKPGNYEVSYYWKDRRTGLLCKCRPDWISADQKTVIDFKTARDVSHKGFQRDAFDHKYFVSAALTLEGIYRATGVRPERYIFLVVRNTPVHLVAAYEATMEEIKLGRAFVRRNLTLLKTCEDSGHWPGLPDEIRPLGLPRYAPKPSEEDEQEDRDTHEDLIEQLEREFAYAAS